MAKTATMVTCPYCLKKHDFRQSLQCPETHYEVPEEFPDNPSLWMLTVGLSQHGKTVYLTALAMALEHLANALDDVTFEPLDSLSYQIIRDMRAEVMENALPKPTGRKKNEPLLMLKVDNLPELGTRNLVVYDVAGELFAEGQDQLHEYLIALKQVKTIWFFVSLENLFADTSIDNMADLFRAYRNGMRRLGASLEGRTMIVVYTQADRRNFTSEIDDYVREDPLSGIADRGPSPNVMDEAFVWEDYVDSMKSMSAKLRDYTIRSVNGGKQFINNAKSAGMRVEFCVTSALGDSPVNGRMMANARRYRVLDPFFWTVAIEAEDGEDKDDPEIEPSRLTLVLSGSAHSELLYEDQIGKLLVEECQTLNIEVQTYMAGHSKVQAVWGQIPPVTPPRYARPALIGPMIDSLPRDSKAILVFENVPLDLNDFRASHWPQQLLLITHEDMDIDADDWPNHFVWRGQQDLPALMNMIKRFMNVTTRKG